MGVTSVKDTVHRYIEFDDFERRVIATPWFQRLRRVKQNDVSATVYPTMQATRFEHALGAMHLAGDCLRAALRSASDQTHADRFLASFCREIEALTKYRLAVERAAEFCVRLARLYGLLHDIGHPPYSHLLESCVPPAEIGLTGTPAEQWHESNGQVIVEQLLPWLAITLPADPEEYALLASVALLGKKTLEGPSLWAVKKLVDSVIDVDRMDFVLRDGRTSGSEFGTYDVERLVQSFRVHVVPDHATLLPSSAHIRPSDKALSAIESLLQERYKIYRWVHFHHRVMQAKALMRYAIRRSLDCLRLSDLRPENYVAPYDEDRACILLGDAWLDRGLDRKFSQLNRTARHLSTEQRRLHTALRALLLREDLGRALWKRSDGYSSGLDYFDRFLRERFESMTDPPPVERALERFGSLANWIAAIFADKATRRLLDQIIELANDGLETEWYLIEVCKFSGGDEESERLVVGSKPQRLGYLTQTSTIAAALQSSYKRDVQLFAFRFSSELPPSGTDFLTPGRIRIADAIAKAFQELPAFRRALLAKLIVDKTRAGATAT